MRAGRVGLAIAASVLALAGCSKSGLAIAPVSGVVTLNSKPLANARVLFEPATKDGIAPGSSGMTDSAGRYELAVTVSGEKGAMVGSHKVRITAAQSAQESSDDTLKKIVEPVPAKYNSQSELSFDVPSGGTDKADFALTSP